MLKVKITLALAVALCAIGASAAPEGVVKRYCTPQEALILTPSEAGYCAAGWWIPGIVDDATHWRMPPTHFRSRVLGNNLLEETVAGKGYDTDGVQGLISLLSPATAGWGMHIWFPTRPEWGWLLVLDGDAVKQEDHWAHIILSDSAIEVSEWLMQATGNNEYANPVTGDRYMYAEVCISMQPERDCSGVPVDYGEWFRGMFQLKTSH